MRRAPMARRGRGAQPGHGREHLPGHVGALAVQPDQEVLPGQLRGHQPDQQLSARIATVTRDLIGPIAASALGVPEDRQRA